MRNGQNDASAGLISIDVMYEYGSGVSQLYIANGGSCDNDCLTNGTPYRNTSTAYDGGVLRTRLAYSTDTSYPEFCTDFNSGNTIQYNCNRYWEDVTPTNYKWLKYMSIPLPGDAKPGGDWDQLLPENTIIPAIKAVPSMTVFNGDLYMIRNACSTNYVHTRASGDFLQACNNKSCPQTCTVGHEVPQLWRLPANCGSATACQSAWELVAEYNNTGRTDMSDATWHGGSEQTLKTANNSHITMLVKNGNRLYIGFDNSAYGVNIWRTKKGVTRPSSGSDFEAVYQTENTSPEANKQFGLGEQSSTKIHSSISVNGYLIFTTISETGQTYLYRGSND